MKNIDSVPRSAEEIIEDLISFHDADEIKNTLELLLECYLSSHVIDIHRRSERSQIYDQVNKLKEFLDYGKMWQESK